MGSNILAAFTLYIQKAKACTTTILFYFVLTT
jgi:hypothetical protein